MTAILRQYTLAVGTSVVEVLPEIERDVSDIYIRNTSSAGQVISLGIAQDAVNNTGLVLNPGEVVTFSAGQGYAVPKERITALSSAISGSLAIFIRLVST